MISCLNMPMISWIAHHSLSASVICLCIAVAGLYSVINSHFGMGFDRSLGNVEAKDELSLELKAISHKRAPKKLDSSYVPCKQ